MRINLVQRLHVTKVFAEENIADGINTDEQQEITVDMIAEIDEIHKQENSYDVNDVRQKKITHSEGVSSIEKILNTSRSKKRLHFQFSLS